MQNPRCPYCSAALPKMPQRKSKCKACGRFIHVKSTPDDRTKRLMTDQQAEVAERAWLAWHEEQEILRLSQAWRIDLAELRAAISTAGGDYKAATHAILKPRADAGERLAMLALQQVAPDDSAALDAKRRVYRDELSRHADGSRRGFVVGLQVRRPKPWPDAVAMLELHRQGLGVADIAKCTGRSTATVERALIDRGEHHACGPHCAQFEGRTYTLPEALLEERLPCSAACVCYWRPLLRIGGKIT